MTDAELTPSERSELAGQFAEGLRAMQPNNPIPEPDDDPDEGLLLPSIEVAAELFIPPRRPQIRKIAMNQIPLDWCPFATKQVLPLDHSDVRSQPPTEIVLHITEGTTESGAFATFAASVSPSRVSAHFIVGRDGTIWQLVALSRVALVATHKPGELPLHRNRARCAVQRRSRGSQSPPSERRSLR